MAPLGTVPLIVQDGDPQMPPPYSFPGVSIRNFPLSADPEKLQQLCDNRLNTILGTPGERKCEYRIDKDDSFVDLNVLTYPRMYSNELENIGYISQHELYFGLSVYKHMLQGSEVPPERTIFVPYIFVDNVWSLISGREVMGYPKLRASFQPLPSEAYPIIVSTDVLTEYSPKTSQTFRPLVEIYESRASSAFTDQQGDTPWPWGALDNLALPSPQVKGARVGIAFPIIQLKQIRDSEETDRACYQALVSSKIIASTFQQRTDLDPAEIKIHRYDNLRIAEVLGLGDGVLKPIKRPCLRKCDLEFEKPQNLIVRCLA